MLNALIYILFSTFEGFVIFAYAFSIFRIDFKGLEKETILTVILISIATYFYHNSSLFSNISLVLNLIALTCFFIVLFKVSPLHALLISALSFATLLTIQGATTLISGLSLDEIMRTDWLRYSFQFFTDSILLLISLLIKKRTFGFTFVPTRYVLKFKLTSLNIAILLTSISAVIVMGIAFNLSLYVGTFFWGMCFAVLIYLGVSKEMSNEFD
ncbi:hypothetical protein [Paenibacillus sp. FSL H3-0333]|uniref:hypothetical protein n=1 Tax=Paenibacillus sp. FSL H3-0333 TaxID=2921373 RepID=UPI0030FA1136